MSTAYELHGEVAVITLNHPPVNGLSHALRSKLAEGISAAGDDERVSAIVLIGSERAFSGGADIREFGTAKGLTLRTMLGSVWDLGMLYLRSFRGRGKVT